MFTGIIEEMGVVDRVQLGGEESLLVIKGSKVLAGLGNGDSIAVNGVCLTVVSHGRGSFAAEVMPETLRKTGLVALKKGDRVNLERALSLGGRLGGHLVTGHIDGVGRILARRREANALVIEVQAPAGVLRYALPRGSVAIDGISLTVVEARDDSFTVSLVPHTAGLTTLGFKGTGDPVNLEGDIIGKYVEKFVLSSLPGREGPGGSPVNPPGGISLEALAEKGYI